MINPISQGQETLVVTSTTTLGYGPGMTAPPRLLLCNATAAMAVVLPVIPPVMPTAPGTPGTNAGTGDGLMITIRNLANYNVTVTAGGSDTVFDATPINAAGSAVTLMACLSKGYWYAPVPPFGAGGIRSISGTSSTATTYDRYIVTPTAGTVNILSPTAYPAGVEVLTVINTSSGSDTITPASGTIAAVGASLTLTTHISAGFATNGTDWFLTHTA